MTSPAVKVDPLVAAENGEDAWVVPTAVPEQALSVPPPSKVPRRWKSWLILVVLLLAVVALVVGLTVGLKDSSSSDNDNGSNTNVGNDGDGPSDDPDGPNDDPDDPSDDIDTPEVGMFDDGAIYNSTNGPLSVELQTFHPSILRGYETCEDMKDALTEAAKFYVNNAILRNAHVTGYEGVAQPVAQPVVGSPEADLAGGEAQREPAAAKGETDYGTNNQEVGVDEADFVKSDGIFVYAAYGDDLVVWRAEDGDVVTRIKMPPIQTDVTEGDPEDDPKDTKPSFVAGASLWYQPHPTISALLLDEESYRLVVVVEGYGNSFRQTLTREPVLSDLASTHLRVYDTLPLHDEDVETKELTLLATKDVAGYYQTARSIGKNAHVVTMTHVNSWQLGFSFERWQADYEGLENDDAGYILLAKEKAQEVIPLFVDRVMEELKLGGDCSRIIQLSLLQTGLSEDDGESFAFPEGILNGFAQISSFDMSASFADENLSTSVSGTFTPASGGIVYASQELLVLATEGYSFNTTTETYDQSTYLFGFHLEEDITRPAAVGQFSGYLLNQFSLDDFDGHLRVAASNREKWGPVLVGEERIWQRISDTSNQVIVMSVPQVAAGSTVEPALMREVGRVDGLGHEGELIRAVRFVDEVGFVVTARQTDPFYTMDLSDPSDPQVVGELNITGWSNYLHPINENNTLILAVGVEANERGVALGLQISLFDVTDFSDPVALQRHVVEETGAWSGSEAQWDHRAFRYLRESKMLIIPVSIYGKENYDGFFVYDVSVDEIAPRFNVSHVESNDVSSRCWFWSRLASRSLVFSGNLTTLKGHSVMSHDLASTEKLWALDLDEEIEKGQCYGYKR